MTVISDTINKMGLPKEVAQGLNQVTAATLGALVGGAAGAASGLNVEANNRQLHPDETKWIQDNASRYAEQKGISEAQAITRLAQQAYRQVQAGAGGTWDADASAFLGQAHGMLAADPNCPTCGPGYMFYATPDQKANPNMYAEQLAQTSEFYAKNGLTLPTSQQIADAVKKGAEIRSNLNTATKAALAVSAGAALSGLSPTLLQWALSNPVAATEAGIITAETAAAIVSGAVTPSGLLRQMSNPQAARVIYDRLATAATKNTESSEVVLGRYLAGNANSYEQVAQARGATYYEVGAWDSMFKELGKEKMWEVNKGFLDKAIVEGKTFVFTNDPETVLKTAPTSFSADEVKHLMNNGYKFVQEGEVWRGIKK
jgi:hypothetical protein